MKSLVIANWKMSPATSREAKQLFEATRRAVEAARSVAVVVAPPALYFRDLKSAYKGKRITFAAQNGESDATGAMTGEVSLAQYKDAGALYAIVGHAESRARGDTNEIVRKKVAAALDLGMTPILCVGESARSSGGEHFNFIKEELRAGLSDVQPQKISKVIIAYEPIWAIGASQPMDTRHMHEMAIFIRKSIVEMKGEAGMNTKILYGGSIDEHTAPSMLVEGDVVGLLVGRASEDGERFKKLLEAIQTA